MLNSSGGRCITASVYSIYVYVKRVFSRSAALQRGVVLCNTSPIRQGAHAVSLISLNLVLWLLLTCEDAALEISFLCNMDGKQPLAAVLPEHL